jgi:porphobilinogen synthase
VTFPERRLRRLRRTPALRRLVAETKVGIDDLVAPLFVKEGIDAPEPIGSMPGVVASCSTPRRACAKKYTRSPISASRR